MVTSIKRSGFTLIELLVVLAVVATLLSLVAPRYFQSIDRAKEAALQQNLSTIRDAIDKFHEDKGRFPGNLEELVTARYLRAIPKDPVTESQNSWIPVAATKGDKGGIANVKSGAPGTSLTGVPFAEF
ncbi:MAG: type II secretion system protein [Betaproteobacteria bacterium]|jgi:general secretion pathway protein G